jgi:pimeloyl-ACP methyl ester carboxylesterase
MKFSNGNVMEAFKRIFMALLAQLLMISLAYSADLSKPTLKIKPLPSNLTSQFANVNGIRLHYIEKGKGHLIILLHGWPETSSSWNKTINALSNEYRVVAPDLRGLGLSEHTSSGYDKKTIVADIKALIDYIGEKQAIIIGHDMGGKVAYVMAHLYPQLVAKLVLVDCLIPGTENADPLHGGAWHYGFHMSTEIPEMLTKGREKEYIRAQIKAWSFKKNAISENAIEEYSRYYSTKGGMTAGFNYYRTLKNDAELVKTFRDKKLTMPVLAISGRYGVGDKLSKALENKTIFLKSIIVDDSGHFVAEESPEIFNSAVIKFLESSY